MIVFVGGRKELVMLVELIVFGALAVGLAGGYVGLVWTLLNEKGNLL